jgi:hypothetical protein
MISPIHVTEGKIGGFLEEGCNKEDGERMVQRLKVEWNVG